MNRTDLAKVWPPTPTAAAEAGHRSISAMQAIRRKCLDCCGNQAPEVRLCETVTCALWPFRSGHHPYTKGRLLQADPGSTLAGGTPVPENPPSSPTGLLRASGARRMENN
jgi:hypothetical protein